MKNMAAPRFKLGDRVRIVSGDPGEDLRGRIGVVADPGDHFRRTKPRWPDTYWKTQPVPGAKLEIVYWIDFGCASPVPGSICGATVSESDLMLA